MPSSAYQSTGGSLKLKGEGSTKKKKKSKSLTLNAQERVKEAINDSKASGSGSGDEELRRERSNSRDASPAVGGSGSGSRSESVDRRYDGKTDAERRFEAAQRKRLEEKVKKAATKTHKDRVAEFNTKLERLSEHYDIPKVGPG